MRISDLRITYLRLMGRIDKTKKTDLQRIFLDAMGVSVPKSSQTQKVSEANQPAETDSVQKQSGTSKPKPTYSLSLRQRILSELLKR